MRILITGGAGFIGSTLAERLLEDGHDLVILDDFNDYYSLHLKQLNVAALKDHVEIVESDIRDAVNVERVFARGNFDAVVHLAARAGVRPSISDPKLYFTTNISGTFNMLEACRYHGVGKFVFASSSSVYGVNKKVPFAESDPIERTISPYAATKLAGEQVCSNYAHLFGIQSVCLRFFTVYGPRQRPDLAISKFARRILHERAIPKFGAGHTARDYTYIDDIIEGIVASIHYGAKDFDIFNLGGSDTTSLNELIELLEKGIGKQAIIDQQPEQPGDVPRTFADVSKAKELLGYSPQTPIAEGITKYLDWLAQNDAWSQLRTHA